jgi:Tfp pilus assembly protein PilF
MPDGLRTVELPAQGVAEPSTASTAPLDGSAPPVTETAQADQRRDLWERARTFGTQAIAAGTALSTFLVAGSFLYVLIETRLQRNKLSLEAISVPKFLTEDGFTSHVVTQNLREAINKVVDDAGNSTTKIRADTIQDMSALTIPKAGISLDTMTAAIRTLLPEGWQKEVSGEFIILGDQIYLRLWLNGRTIFDRHEAFSQSQSGMKAAQDLMEQGAIRIVTETRPYVAALALFEEDLPKALAAVERFIHSAPPPPKPEKARAFNLKGRIAEEQGRTDDAIAAYRTAIDLDPRYATPHNNLGYVWKKAKNISDAIREYQTAMRLDPHYAKPHNNIGVIRKNQGKIDDAIREYQTAIRLDPEYATPHENLVHLWESQGKTDAAIAEYQAAIHLDPDNATLHYELGVVLQNVAMKATASETPKLLSDACAAFTRAADLAPRDSLYQERIQDVDAEMRGQGHCPTK